MLFKNVSINKDKEDLTIISIWTLYEVRKISRFKIDKYSSIETVNITIRISHSCAIT